MNLLKQRVQTKMNYGFYGIAGDGTYDLEFVVGRVSVDYIYDGDRDVYEIHLIEDDNATQVDFIQTFTKEEGVALNIEFVKWVINLQN